MASSRFNVNEIVIMGSKKGFVNSSAFSETTNLYMANVTWKWTLRQRWQADARGRAELVDYWAQDLDNTEEVAEIYLTRAPES